MTPLQKLLNKYPDLNAKQIKMIANMVLAARAGKLRGAYIVRFSVPYLGLFRSHASKKVRRYNKNKVKDRKRKKIESKNKSLTKEKLLF